MPPKTRAERGCETLTPDRLRELLSYDPETGIFRWRVRRGRKSAGAEAGSPEADGYMRVTIDYEHHQLHRLVWLYLFDRWPEPYLDHRDRDRSNNALANLREATAADNMQNRSSNPGSRSPLLGAHWDKERQCWLARIMVNGRTKHLGRFATDTEAHAAYVAAKSHYHPFGAAT